MWQKLLAWARDSETILWARLNVLFGIVLQAIAMVDPQMVVPYIDPKYVPLWLIFSGIVTEIARRMRADDV
ncbi:MAG TPA: hypothetical protein VF226_02880 [Hyphomicrobiaceae bacterium]|jgi:hypothetical protein